MISNRCARKSLVTNCNSIISKNYLRFLVDSNENVYCMNNKYPHYLYCIAFFFGGVVYSPKEQHSQN